MVTVREHASIVSGSRRMEEPSSAVSAMLDLHSKAPRELVKDDPVKVTSTSLPAGITSTSALLIKGTMGPKPGALETAKP
jgi:hypothetical protein